jgi:hypothetical protein
MVGVAAEGLRHDFLELGFDLVDILAGREAGPVADPEDVGVDRERLLAPGGVEHDVGGLAADAGQRFELAARARDLAAMLFDQRVAERDDVLRLGVEQADGPDRIAQRILPEIDHLPRAPDPLEQRARRDVDADVGGLRRQDHRDQQLIGVGELELGGRRGVGLGQPAEEFEHFRPGHSASITSRMV